MAFIPLDFPRFIIAIISNRWWKAVLCFLSIIVGLLDLVPITFLADFKNTPLVGFYIARTSIIILIVSWLALGVISLFTSKYKQVENGSESLS